MKNTFLITAHLSTHSIKKTCSIVTYSQYGIYILDESGVIDKFLIIFNEMIGVDNTFVDDDIYILERKRYKFLTVPIELLSIKKSSKQQDTCCEIIKNILEECIRRKRNIKLKLHQNNIAIQFGGRDSGIIDIADFQAINKDFGCFNQCSVLMHEIYEQYQVQIIKNRETAHDMAEKIEEKITGFERVDTSRNSPTCQIPKEYILDSYRPKSKYKAPKDYLIPPRHIINYKGNSITLSKPLPNSLCGYIDIKYKNEVTSKTVRIFYIYGNAVKVDYKDNYENKEISTGIQYIEERYHVAQNKCIHTKFKC